MEISPEKLEELVLTAFDTGWFAGNAGRNWNCLPTWNDCKVKKELELLLGKDLTKENKVEEPISLPSAPLPAFIYDPINNEYIEVNK